MWTVGTLPLWGAVATSLRPPAQGVDGDCSSGECVPQSWKLQGDTGMGHGSLISLPVAEELQGWALEEPGSRHSAELSGVMAKGSPASQALDGSSREQ